MQDGVEVLVGFIYSFMDLLAQRGLSCKGSLRGGSPMFSIVWSSEGLQLLSVSNEVSLLELGKLGCSTMFLLNLPLESWILGINTNANSNNEEQR